MAKRCTRYKRVRSRYGGTVRRCAKFSGRSARSKKRRGGYRRRGKRPFNKGRKCVAWGTATRRGRSVRVCRSYGSTSGWRTRRGRRGASRSTGMRIPGTSMYVTPPSESQRVASAYRGSQQAGERWRQGQRGWFQRLLMGPGG